MTRTIDYGNLMHEAMRGLIQNVLKDVRDQGLPGDHHFFITFDTTHPDARLADWLRDRYPKEMTVVMQHWFDDLQVGHNGFSVTLNFGDAPENLFVPFDAIETFVDPSVEFGLRFETQPEPSQEDAEGRPDIAFGIDDPTDEPPKPRDPAPSPDAQVVSLDQFRK